MTSPVGLKKIESNTTAFSSCTTDDCGNNNIQKNNNMTDDIAISPIEGYSEVKEISSPYSKIAHVGSSGESTPTASGSNENIMISSSNKISSTTSATSPTLNSPSSIISNRNFCNISGLNDIPQWKKDLISRRKNNIARTIEANHQSDAVPFSSTFKTVTEQNPSVFLKKLSPISSTTTTKSINSSTVELLKTEIKSPVTLSSSASFSSINSKSNQSISSNKISYITSSSSSSSKDVAIDDINNRESSMQINQSNPTNILSSTKGIINDKNINTSQQQFTIIIKEDAKKINKSSLVEATSATATNELLLTNKNDLITTTTTTTTDNNIISCSSRNQMPVKFNNVKSVANKYKENLNLNSSTILSSSPSSSSTSSSLLLLSPSALKSSTSVVKTIVGEITSKGQYTNSSNKMIDSLTTIIKSEKSNYNNMATATTQPITTAAIPLSTIELQQQPEKIGKLTNRIGIQIPQQNHKYFDDSISNNTTTTNAPPIPMRRTSLNHQHTQLQQKQLKYYMATSHHTSSDNIINIKNSMELDSPKHIHIELEIQHKQQHQQHEQHEQHNTSSTPKEIEDETEETNLLLTNQLHSRYESNKVGLKSCDVDEFAFNKNNKIQLKTSVISDNNTNCSNLITKEDNFNESINNSVIKSNDGDGSNIDDIDTFLNSENLQNLVNNKIKNNNLIKDNNDKIDDDFINDSNKTCGNVLILDLNKKKSLPQSLELSGISSTSTSIISPQYHHHQGYIKNPTVNKNSTATINKYIAAAAAKNQNITTTNNNNIINSNKILLQKNSISPSTSPSSLSPSSSPKKNLLINSCVVITTVATTATETTVSEASSLPSTISSPPPSSTSLSSSSSLLSNYKQQRNKNIIQIFDNSINNKMVAVPEIQLKTNSTSIRSTSITNGESSTNNGVDSITTTINNTKSTATINNSNINIKRTKMINNIKNTNAKNKDDEFNDFDPSEELQYGPGIVSKLRCRYLSLALRQSTGKQRLPLDNLRRATSLNNLLDGSGSTNVVVGKNVINGATTNKSTNIKNNGNCNIIDEDNDYEHLIINSNHNHYINNKNRNQKLLNQQQQNGLSNNLKEIKEQEIILRTITENSCSSSSPSSSTSLLSAAVNDINGSSSLLLTTNVEKPDQQQQDQQQQQQQQKNSFTCNNKKLNVQQTSADVGAISTILSKNNSVSAITAEKNLLNNKTGCNTNFDQYHQQEQQYNNHQSTNQYIRNTAAAVAAGIIRSGRQVKRGNDSIKRARSVEALLCEKPDIWSVNNTDTTINVDVLDNDNIVLNDSDDIIKDNKNGGAKKDINLMSNSAHAAIHWNNNNISCNSPTNGNASPILTEVTIEDKITNAREQRKHEKHPPKRLTSVIDDTERPPPDVVKQTLKIFEASANRRGGRGISKNHQGGHVAMKVANYKSIISQDQKPPISYPKPPLSPKRLGTLNSNSSATANAIKSKPNTLNIQNGNSALNTNNINNNNNNKKFNKISPKGNSPVSSLTKRFNSQNSTEDLTTITSENVICKSPIPFSGIASPTTLSHAAYLRNRNESTPIRTTATNATQQNRAPDIIPRKLFDNNLGISSVVDTTTTTTNQNLTDSPIALLAKRMDRLRIETPSSSSTSSSQIGGGSVTPTKSSYKSHYKSSESESTDYDDDNNYSYDVTVHDDDDDIDDDEHESIDGGANNELIVKKISKTALENISKAGSSQCFSFKNVKTTPLIGVNPMPTTTTSGEQITPTPAPKQVGIIRPLVAEPKINSSNIVSPTTTITQDCILNNSQTDKLLKLQSSFDNTGDVINKSQSTIQENLPPQPLKRNSIGIDIDVRAIVAVVDDDDDDNLVITNLSQNHLKQDKSININKNSNINNITSTIESNSLIDNNIIKPALTSREIEKNLINEKKNELANLESCVGNSNITTTTTTATTTINNSNLNTSNSSELNNWQQQLVQKKKNSTNNYSGVGGPIEAQNNIMVFNFKDRKEVPDYIENDGLFIKRKRELPKPNESGFVLLGDLSLETSTDPDDSWTMGPPSPCNVEFENANIIIDGKSSLRYRSRDGSLRVQFDDTLTSTFEYPSESSLLDDFSLTPTDSFYTTTTKNSNAIDIIDNKTQHHVEVEELIPITPIQMLSTASSPLGTTTTTTTTSSSAIHTKSLGNMPIGSVPLGNYTPVKVQLQRHFELGVTRVPNPTDGQSINDFLLSEQQQQQQQQQNGHSNKISSTSNSKNTENNKSSSINSIKNEYNNVKSTNGIYSSTNIITNDDDDDDDDDDKLLTESDSLQYLKPATDDLTVVYSEGTQKTDLLY